MPLKIICLGKTRESWIEQGIAEYRKRLAPHWKIAWQELKDVSLKTAGSVENVKKQESLIISKALNNSDYVIALDENGQNLNSTGFACRLKTLMMKKDITFIIGGVYGLDKAILERTDLKLSFSEFTFPHQLIRLILMEQLYRSWTIISGKTYHY